jgi:hypothetical protein
MVPRFFYSFARGDASDSESLCRAFGFAPRDNHSGIFELRSTLRELIAAELSESEDLRGPYRVTERWEQVQRALDISLVEAANLTRHDALAVRPLFGPRPELTAAPHVFVLMPFDEDLQPVYGQIKKVCRKLHISVERADGIFSASLYGRCLEIHLLCRCNSSGLHSTESKRLL